jgi:SAM-dependent methyltransferase
MAGEGAGVWTDPVYLRGEQYRSAGNLSSRQSIYAYQQPRIDLPKSVLDLAAPTGDEVVVDIGCGNGAYLAELLRRGHRGPVVGVDASAGMLRAASLAAPPALTLVADAGMLPLRDAVCSLALANHMLYHLADPALGVKEFHRVLAPGGRLVVVLNAHDHLVELRRAAEESWYDLGLPTYGGFRERVGLEKGEELLRVEFGAICRHDFVSRLVLSDRRPLEAYVRSMFDTALVPERARERYVQGVLDRLEPDSGGVLEITAHPGCFICS